MDQRHSLDDPFDSTFNDVVTSSIDHFHVPGVSIAVVDKERTFSKGWGYSTISSVPASPKTLYWVGSTTKSFTAAVILKLVEAAQDSSNPLKLSTPLSSLIDFVLPDEYASRHVTIEDALSHRTGMPRHDRSYGGPNVSLKDVVHNLRHLPLTAEIRQEWQYCNMMYYTLSHLIETVTGSCLSQVFRDYIWKPLDMDSTFLSLREAKETGKSLLARGYFFDTDSAAFIPYEEEERPLLSGAGGIISSVEDFAKYLRAIMHENSILSKESYRQLRTPRSFVPLAPDKKSPYTGPLLNALGWFSTVYRNEILYFHGGRVSGFGSFMLYVPGKDWGIVLMANADFGAGECIMKIAFELIDRLLETPEDEKYGWKKWYDDMVSRETEAMKDARKKVFPDAPDPVNAMKHSLPLRQYTGRYWHPGYQQIDLILVDAPKNLGGSHADGGEILHANVDKTDAHKLDFEHVNGEHFLVRIYPPNLGPVTLLTESVRAEFVIGSNGKVEKVGIAYESQMKDELVWFKRTGEAVD